MLSTKNNGLTEEEIIFKEKWLSQAKDSLMVEDVGKLETIFNSYYRKSKVEIENTETGRVRIVEGASFFNKIKDKYILNESGLITMKHKFKTAVTTPIILSYIFIRQIKKKLKVKAYEIGDSINIPILTNEESSLKLIINGLYGLFLYLKSVFFNPSIGATITAGGRSIIAVTILSIESCAKYRNYQVDAHLQLIAEARKHTDFIINKYTLKKVDVETVLKHMLQDRYGNYYLESFLREVLRKLTDDELSVLYIKNNFPEFIKIPEVKELITHIYTLNTTDEEYINEKDTGILDSINAQFNVNYNTKKSFMVYYAKSDKYKESTNLLKEMSAELLLGFFYYSGDYENGEYYETHVDLVKDIPRTKVPISDTDSAVTTVFDEVELLNKEYSEHIPDEFISSVVSSVIATVIYGGLISYSLDRYVKKIGVDEDYAKYVDMEEETTMYDLNGIENKKQYIYNHFIQDGNFSKSIYKNIKIKGLPVIKSDYNKDISAKVISIIKEKIMVNINELDYADIVYTSKKMGDAINKELRSDDYILNKSTVKKSNKEELAHSDYKLKVKKLWDRMGLDGELEFPGSFRELPVSLDNDILRDLEELFPNIYEAFRLHTKEVVEVGLYLSCVKKSKKLLEEGLQSSNSYYETTINSIIKSLAKNKLEFDEEIFSKLKENIFEGKDAGLKDAFRKRFKFTAKAMNIEITNADIIDKIDRLGLPVDIQVVPDFIKHNNYVILDSEFISMGEQLIGAVTHSIGLTTVKTKSKAQIVTNVLATY